CTGPNLSVEFKHVDTAVLSLQIANLTLATIPASMIEHLELHLLLLPVGQIVRSEYLTSHDD
ncbi:MAG: hypothetical protein ACFFFC_16215, partial [Candidatus Thorarchaeota archaeon]